MAAFEESYAFTRSRVGTRLKIAVAVDGSKVSMKALSEGISFMHKERNDTLDLIHVVDEDATILQSSKHVEKECDLLTSSAGLTSSSQFFSIPKLEEGVIATIAKKAEDFNSDLLLVGAYGLKVESGEEAEESFTVMGSVSDGSLRRTDVSTGIIKVTSHEPDVKKGDGQTFMLATDDSPSAKVAFALVITKLAHVGKDKVCVFMNIENAEERLAKYKVECDKVGIQCELHASHDHTTDVAEDILNYAKEKSVDVLVMGTNGFTKQALGSVSDKCSKAARCTTIIVKDPRAN